MATQHVRESVVENHLVKRATALGLLCLKTQAVAVRAIPDRLVLGHDAHGAGVVLFIEVKRPGAQPRASQTKRIQDLRNHGAHAIIVDSTDAVDIALQEYFTAPSIAIALRDPNKAPLPGARATVVTPRL